MHENDALDPILLARMAPHLLAVSRDVTCFRIAGEIATLEELADTMDAVATIAQHHVDEEPSHRDKLVAFLRLSRESNLAHAQLSSLKADWSAAALTAICDAETGQMLEMAGV